MMPMAIVGIETSCDETAAGVVSLDGVLLANVVDSQANLHAKYGGIVPEVASRQHILNIRAVVEEALAVAELNWQGVTALAVTNGPGLAGSLLIGVAAAKGIAAASGLPLIGVNHLEGHVAAAWIDTPGNDVEQLERLARAGRVACLVVSGGHTETIVLEEGRMRLIGQTRDDAAGEAFDKVARLLGLAYPGGPEIQRVAARAPGAARFNLPSPLKGGHDLSFSGLKTAVARLAERLGRLDDGQVADLASQFQSTVVDTLLRKLDMVVEEFNCGAVAIVGGVAANARLREEARKRMEVPVFIPPIGLCTDNGAMIARRGLELHRRGVRDHLDLDVLPGLGIGVAA